MLATDQERLGARARVQWAKHGIQGMVGGGSARAARCTRWWSTAKRRTPGSAKEIELGRAGCASAFHFLHGDSREQGMKGAAKYYEENMKMFGELRLVRAPSPRSRSMIMRDPKRAPTAKLPRIEDAVKGRRLPVVQCDDLIEHIKALGEEIPRPRTASR